MRWPLPFSGLVLQHRAAHTRAKTPGQSLPIAPALLLMVACFLYLAVRSRSAESQLHPLPRNCPCRHLGSGFLSFPVRPGQDRGRGQLGAVVGDDRLGSAPDHGVYPTCRRSGKCPAGTATLVDLGGHDASAGVRDEHRAAMGGARSVGFRSAPPRILLYLSLPAGSSARHWHKWKENHELITS
jgi:hypothetical protein